MVSGPQAAKQRAAALRRVAIVLSSLPAPVATRLLGGVDAESRRQLRRAMSSLADVDPMERRLALQNFAGSLKQSQAPDRAAAADEVTLRHGAPAPSGGEAAVKDTEPPRVQDPPESPLAFLSDVEDDQLIEMVGSEHPQTIALVLASIAPAQAARLLPRLEPDQRQEAMSRIGRLGEIPDEALGEIAQHLRDRVDQRASAEKTSNGRRALDAILAELSSARAARSAPHSEDAPHAGGPDAGGPDAAGQIDRLRGIGRLGVTEEFASDEAERHAPQSVRRPAVRRNPDEEPAEAGATNSVRSPAFRRNGDEEPAKAGAANDATAWPTDEIHDHLARLAPAELCRALAQVDTRDALLALCGLPTETAEAAIRSLPRAQAKQVRRSLASLGSLQLREIDRAKEKVAARSLGESPGAAPRPDAGAAAVPLAA